MDCEEFKTIYRLQRVNCCESCHEDNNDGYGEDLWFMIDDRNWNICCALVNEYEGINDDGT